MRDCGTDWSLQRKTNMSRKGDIMIMNFEYVIRKGDEFHGIPYSILFCGFEIFTRKSRAIFETDEYEILSEAEYQKKVNAFYEQFCGKWKETKEQRYNDMLDILPPLKWMRDGFFVSEAYTLDIYPFHQEFNGRYFEAYFRIGTPRDEILKSLAEFIKMSERKI